MQYFPPIIFKFILNVKILSRQLGAAARLLVKIMNPDLPLESLKELMQGQR